MPSGRSPRVEVVNVSDGGLLYWVLRLYAFVLAGVVAVFLASLLGLYFFFAEQLPPSPELSSYARTAPGLTTVFGQDGTLLAEFGTERREIVPLSKVPRPLLDAFIATEDRRFYTHRGVDVRGLGRALAANLRAGQMLQGGSTITQQVAKAYLSPEKSLSRKIKEAIFARRLEARYSKREILALYVNHIFLGSGAYGVQAAARRYFDKDVSELDVGQMALIAGLARAPSRDSPLVSVDNALDRRATVLDNMVELGVLARADAVAWKQRPLGLRPRPDYFHELSPYFTEQVRRELVKQLGQKSFYEAGYRVETTALPLVDLAAQENVDAATRKLDKRQGWRGPEAHLLPGAAAEFRARARSLYGEGPPEEGKLYLGLVERVGEAAATVLVGARAYPLPIARMAWAAPFSASDATNDKLITRPAEALKKGDVVWVRWAFRSHVPRFSEFTYNQEGDAAWLPELERRAPKTIELELEQTPRVQAAVHTFDHQNGYVLAMAGGTDFDQSEFNRATQACRQPGSAYKPIYYSLALDRGYSYETMWNDKPKAEVDPITGELWVPQNIDGSYNVQVSLEKALVWSKNPPSVEIFHILGVKDVEAWAHRLGLTTPLITSPKCEKEFCSSLALGASCVHIDEMGKAFAVFARNGRPIAPIFVRRVVGRDGRVLMDHSRYDDPWLEAADKLDRIADHMGIEPAPVIEPRTAFLTTKLLREIVTTGHSGPIRATKIIAAGKTGTSSHTSDVWFIGFTSRWMTTVWMGDDTYQRQLGYKDASFMLSVPMWARYMAEVVGSQPLEEIPWERPANVKASDAGGPLKAGYPAPPPAGIGVDGRPIALPEKLQKVIQAQPGTLTAPGVAPLPGGPSGSPAVPPPNLVRQKKVRVPSASPTPSPPPH